MSIAAGRRSAFDANSAGVRGDLQRLLRCEGHSFSPGKKITLDGGCVWIY